MKIVYFLLGYACVYVKKDDVAWILNLCMHYSIPYTNFKSCEDGGVCLKFKEKDHRRLERLCYQNQIEICVCSRGGIPHILSRYKARAGIILGVICAFLMVIYFESFLWDIRISGNSSITSAQIIQTLDSYGVRIGVKKNKIDTHDIENKILIESDTISWISINIQGNIAQVEIRETAKGGDAPKTKFANVVAKKSGIVEYTQIYNGNVAVRAGEYVNEGDLLIGGIYDSKRVGFRFTRAAGNVFARTVQEICVKIPLEYEEKQYSDKVNCEKSLNFFGFSLKISKKVWNSGELYDTIKRVEEYDAISGLRLPVFATKTSYYEYEYVKARRTPEAARELAYFELNRKIEALGDVEIIKKSISTTVSDNELILVCTLTCIEDISTVSEFDVDLSLREEN